MRDRHVVQRCALAAILMTPAAAPLPAFAQETAPPAACGQLAAEHPALKGREIVVGVSPAPANYSATDPADPANVIGIEPDILKAAADCLGFTFTYSRLDFAGLIPALQAGRINVIAAGMYSSDERSKQVDFVEYMRAGQASLVRAGNPKNFASLADVCDATAAQIVGTVENELFARQSEACTAAGKGAITPLQFQSIDRAFAALAQGQADILITDAGVASYLAQTAGDRVQVGFGITSDFLFGFGIAKSDTALRDALLASLKAQYADGSLAAALERWGFSPEQMHEPSVKTQ